MTTLSVETELVSCIVRHSDGRLNKAYIPAEFTLFGQTRCLLVGIGRGPNTNNELTLPTGMSADGVRLLVGECPVKVAIDERPRAPFNNPKAISGTITREDGSDLVGNFTGVSVVDLEVRLTAEQAGVTSHTTNDIVFDVQKPTTGPLWFDSNTCPRAVSVTTEVRGCRINHSDGLRDKVYIPAEMTLFGQTRCLLVGIARGTNTNSMLTLPTGMAADGAKLNSGACVVQPAAALRPQSPADDPSYLSGEVRRADGTDTQVGSFFGFDIVDLEVSLTAERAGVSDQMSEDISFYLDLPSGENLWFYANCP